MSVASKIMWSEGLTLGPQHFQCQDRYHETRLQQIASALNPYFWGVSEVQWDLDGLANNRLSANVLSVIFPDGEIYEAPTTDLLPEPVDLSRLPANLDTLTFCVALALVKPHGGNADENGRYVCHDIETSDLYSEALAIEVPFLKKQARFIASAEASGQHISVPVVRVRRAPQGGFELDPTFVPPSITIGAAPALGRMLEGLVSVMTAKIDTLQRTHRKASSEVYEVGAGDISSWWMLNILSTASAQLMHCARSPGMHPEAMFRQMLAAVGGLMTFSDRYKTADLPAYRHEMLGEVFAELESLLRDLVDTVIGTKYFIIPLIADRGRRAYAQAVLDPAKVTFQTQLCLSVTADMPGLELVATVPIRLKVAAPDDLESIVGSALPGVPLAHMPQVPPAIPVRPNTYYFSLSTKSPLYEKALATGALAIYTPDGIPGLKLELIAVT
ncbi:type VI secretion system baseplate subunit TssK [Massilia oculi]|uniref:Type VI secretion system baseplate subunit TssK n=1 Tax=Massilia oculi TaxID=945844 RepID=A0A2S2DDW1_9BURK|nr:type VI secretion system baseplate subunit TssK [Massilia oculi]AWL03573.1 type VI secretion system baseplate subunit TssK [Massilia oculi]